MGRRAYLGLPLHGIPEQVAGGAEDVGPVPERGFEPALDRGDPLELKRILSHRLTSALSG